MEPVLDPATAGGLAAFAAVLACAMATAWLTGAAWARGRMRAAARASGPAQAPAPAPGATAGKAATGEAREGEARADRRDAAIAADAPAACQQRALEERRALLAEPVALAELAAEIAAIRRNEQVFGDPASGGELLVLPRMAGTPRCRFIGLSGQPTCPATSGFACSDSSVCPGFAALAEPQPVRREGARRAGGAGGC